MITKYNKFKLYEYKEIPTSGKESRDIFMDRLYNKIKEEIMPNIPKDFNIDYVRGKEIIIETNNEEELKVGVKVDGDNLSFYAKPITGPEYEYSFSFSPFSINEIFEMVKDTFEKSENYGLKKTVEGGVKGVKDKGVSNIKDIIKDNKKRPKRVKRSISIPAIEDVLTEVYVKDQMILVGNLTVEELLRRMLDRDRK
ncbi:MAG: hypothetical protein ACOC3V_02220 [bacterium]